MDNVETFEDKADWIIFISSMTIFIIATIVFIVIIMNPPRCVDAFSGKSC